MYLTRKLSDTLSTYKNLRAADTCKKSGSHRYSVTLGVGGNVGDVKRRFKHLCVYLNKDRRIAVKKISSVLKNPPFGYFEQDEFFNAVMVLATSMQPRPFLDHMMRVERRFSRKRSFENAPRTLDLDIIFFDNRVIKTQRLCVPHPEWFKRESVLIPLMDIYK